MEPTLTRNLNGFDLYFPITDLSILWYFHFYMHFDWIFFCWFVFPNSTERGCFLHKSCKEESWGWAAREPRLFGMGEDASSGNWCTVWVYVFWKGIPFSVPFEVMAINRNYAMLPSLIFNTPSILYNCLIWFCMLSIIQCLNLILFISNCA